MIEWLVACLYTVSGLLLLLSFKLSLSIFTLSLWLPLKLLKLFISLALCACFFISANQISSYFISDVGKQIAEIDINYVNKQKYVVTLKTLDLTANDLNFEISGDYWLLDLRLVTWHSLLAGLGLDALYRLERIGGRYQSIDDELNSIRTIYRVDEDKITDQIWSYISSYSDGLLFRSSFGSGLYGPMTDNAKYGVFLTASGAEVIALNGSAKKALNEWK